MIIFIDPEKVSDKLPHSFMIKTLHKLRIEGDFFNLMRTPSKNLLTFND